MTLQVIYRKFNKKGLRKSDHFVLLNVTERTTNNITLYSVLKIQQKVIIKRHKRDSLDLTFQLCQYMFWLVWSQPHKQTHTHKHFRNRFGEMMMFDRSVKNDLHNQQDKSKYFIKSPWLLMINKEIFVRKRHQSKLHSLHSYLQAHTQCYKSRVWKHHHSIKSGDGC